MSPLTPRQLDVARAYALTGDQQAAADSLGIRLRTIKTHMDAIYQRLDVHSSIEMFRVLGWLHVPGTWAPMPLWEEAMAYLRQVDERRSASS